MRLKRIGLAATAAVVAIALSGCGIGLGTAGGFSKSGELTGPVEGIDLGGESLSVGSKNFTESILLGKMTVIMLKSAGADVKDLTNIPGSAAAREAQLAGQIDLTWEYTGTAWLTYLENAKPIPDERKQYIATRDADLRENDLVWLPPAPMNDTYTMAITAESEKKYGITKLSEMSKVPAKERTFCIESEFTNRPDGLKGMLDAYGLRLGSPQGVPRKNLRTLQTGAIYDATAKGQCTFGEVFTTDGRIKALDLTPLADDRSFFPKYNASLVVPEKVLEESPDIEKLFGPVSEKLTNDVIAELNAEVDVDGRDPAEVAWDWLREEKLVD
ncbi:osmoprotectant transport system substrate-binding protein [Nocardioides albertanoniae]|uniref:Osmoprotectant transport system substrate-binding protein n=1 Tax=Nocardioides albertanoniae TaxID=1175486 RepID=A0A543A8Y1_9ACTN|nr:glycine betaine ABC transporter substrate-binding protein [Nocardioides albertanoniae]TQL69063.1 osmoprotectant transport system substrate-binding protein [Nocardioides albertanoniae]